MIKRTLHFGNPAYLHLENKQLIVKLPQVEKNKEMKRITWLRTEPIGLYNVIKVRVNHLGQIVSVGEY